MLLLHLIHRCVDSLVLKIELPPFGTLVRAGCEENLQGRVGKDDTADVPTLHDTPIFETNPTLNRHQSLPDTRHRRHGRRHQGAFLCTDGLTDIFAIHQNPHIPAITLEFDGVFLRQTGHLGLGHRSEGVRVPRLKGEHSDRTVHRSGIEIGNIEATR